MTNVRIIHANWHTGQIRFIDGTQLARQYDHLSNMVVFDNAPLLPNYYLIVDLKETEHGRVKTFEPIRLSGSFWLIPNVYTQLAQEISFQVCCKTESGDFEQHSAQFKGRIIPSKKHTNTELDVNPSVMFDPYKKWVQDLAMASGAIIIDSELDDESENPVQNKVIAAKFVELEQADNALNDNLSQQEEAIFTQFTPLFDIWETGIIDASGALGNNSHRFRMKQITTYPYDMEISVDDGYIGYICFYDGTDTFAFRSQGFNHYAVPKNTKFRVWVMKSDDSADDGYKHVKFSTVAYAGYLRSNYKDDEQSAEFLAVYRQGGLSSSGVYSSNYARIMTPNVYTLEQESEVVIKSGFAIDIQTFNGDTFVSRTGWCKDTVVVPAGTYKFSVAKSPEDPSIMADVVEFSSAVMFRTLGTGGDMKVINGQSFDYGIKYPTSFVVESLLDDLATMTANVGKVTDEFAICYQRKPKSYRIENNGTATSEIRFTLNTPIAYDGIQEFTIALYIPDASNIDHLRFDCMSTTWKKTVNATFVDGWNFIRVNTNGTDMGASATEYRFRLFVYYTDNSIISPVYLGEINAVKPPHASLIFVDDGPYGSFLDLAYPVLTSIGCPVTWAIECASLGETRVGNRSLISLSELTTLEEDGISEFSWHGYNGEKTLNLNAVDTAKANLKAIRFLARRGDITGKIFRAVWPGNTAPNYQLAIEDLDACGTYNGAHGYCLYPYEDKHNLPRNSLQTRDTTYIDDMFDYLKHTHTVCYVYTHGIIDSTSFDPNEQDMRLDMLQYFADKIQTGISEGWLKATTFNRLEREYWG